MIYCMILTVYLVAISRPFAKEVRQKCRHDQENLSDQTQGAAEDVRTAPPQRDHNGDRHNTWDTDTNPTKRAKRSVGRVVHETV